MNRYDESAFAARWMLFLVAFAAIGSIAAALVALAGREEGQWGLAIPLLGVGALLTLMDLMFMRLRITVTDQQVRFRFGPFGPTLKRSEVRLAEVSPYRWVAFGGWGIRLGRVSGRFMRAYSVPFVRTGVAIETASGTRYYVSSRRPEALAAAILEGRSREGSA